MTKDKPPTANEIVLERTVKYYAVDKSGRRLPVDRDVLERNYKEWVEKDGMRIETDVHVRNVPGYGKVNLIGS